MSIKSLIKNIRYDKTASSFSPSGGYGSTISRMFQAAGYDPNARTFRMGSGGKITPKSSDKHVSKTHQAVDQAVSQGDILLIDTSKFEIKKDIKNSVINIYNPKKVILESSSQDFTSEAEKREMDLEGRRKSRTLGLFGISGVEPGVAPSARRGDEEKSSSTKDEVSEGVFDGLVKWLGIGGGTVGTGAVGRRFLSRRPPSTTAGPRAPVVRATPTTVASSTTSIARSSYTAPSRIMFYEAEAARLAAEMGPLRATTLEQMMFEYGARRGLGQGAIRAGTATVATRIASTRLALGALKGGAIALTLLPDILAIYAELEAGKLNEQLLQQQEQARYPYGKGRSGLLEVRQSYGGKPKIAYHMDALSILPEVRKEFSTILDQYELAMQSHLEANTAVVTSIFGPTVRDPNAGKNNKIMAKNARDELETVMVRSLPPWLLLQNPEAEILGEADNMFKPKNILDLMNLHIQEISNSPEDTIEIIPSMDSQSTRNLEDAIRTSMSQNAMDMSLFDEQDPSKATSESTLMGGLENISSGVYNVGASTSDSIGGIFSTSNLEEMRTKLKEMRIKYNRDMSTIDDRPSSSPATSGDTTIIQIDGGGGGGTQIPDKVSSRSDENRMLQNLAMGIPIQERNVLLA